MKWMNISRATYLILRFSRLAHGVRTVEHAYNARDRRPVFDMNS